MTFFNHDKFDCLIDVFVGPMQLPGRLAVPQGARGLVVFAHGSGSSRFSARSQMVSRTLQSCQFGTLLMDLLTQEEEFHRENVFDIELLAERLDEASEWITEIPEFAHLPIGYFGASTGAGAALVAAARAPGRIKAVVSRGGRPDLAGGALQKVRSPTLLIVGGADEHVVTLNQSAFAQLNCEKSIEIIPGATHLFPEKGALERVSQLASNWFEKYMPNAVPERRQDQKLTGRYGEDARAHE